MDVGIKKLKTGVDVGGVGWLVVPEGSDRKTFIEDCYRTQTVSINGGEGYGCFSAVPCPQNVLENLIFPVEDNRGTPVIWVRDGISRLPLIVGWLRKEGDHYSLGEHQWRISRGEGMKNVDIFVDGVTSTLLINVLGDSEEPANVDIVLSSSNKDSTFTLSTDNEINVNAAKKISLSTNSEVNLSVDEKGVTKGQLRYVLGTGWELTDEFGNVIRTSDGLLEIIGEKINHNDGAEPMVLGDTLSTLLEDLLTALQKLTVMTPSGASTVPINVADFAAIQQRINDIKSKKSNLD